MVAGCALPFVSTMVTLSLLSPIPSSKRKISSRSKFACHQAALAFGLGTAKPKWPTCPSLIRMVEVYPPSKTRPARNRGKDRDVRRRRRCAAVQRRQPRVRETALPLLSIRRGLAAASHDAADLAIGSAVGRRLRRSRACRARYVPLAHGDPVRDGNVRALRVDSHHHSGRPRRRVLSVPAHAAGGR